MIIKFILFDPINYHRAKGKSGVKQLLPVVAWVPRELNVLFLFFLYFLLVLLQKCLLPPVLLTVRLVPTLTSIFVRRRVILSKFTFNHSFMPQLLLFWMSALALSFVIIIALSWKVLIFRQGVKLHSLRHGSFIFLSVYFFYYPVLFDWLGFLEFLLLLAWVFGNPGQLGIRSLSTYTKLPILNHSADRVDHWNTPH